jgi:transcriptional regulator with XRE-family HTH domain
VAIASTPTDTIGRLAPRSTLVAVPGLRYWRIQRAMSQKDLAEAIGVALSTVARLEAGGDARLTTVRRLAEALNVDPRELMAASPEEPDAMAAQEQLAPVPGLLPIRMNQRMTQRTLADKAGVDRATIANLELGAAADAATIRKLSQALGVTPAELQA